RDQRSERIAVTKFSTRNQQLDGGGCKGFRNRTDRERRIERVDSSGHAAVDVAAFPSDVNDARKLCLRDVRRKVRLERIRRRAAEPAHRRNQTEYDANAFHRSKMEAFPMDCRYMKRSVHGGRTLAFVRPSIPFASGTADPAKASGNGLSRTPVR